MDLVSLIVEALRELNEQQELNLMVDSGNETPLYAEVTLRARFVLGK